MKFDLHSSQGVVQALQAIRNSSLDADEKNDLRDLVFLYTNGGGDPEIKTQLEARLATLKEGDTTSRTTSTPGANQSQPKPPEPATPKAESQTETTEASTEPAPAAKQSISTTRPTPAFSVAPARPTPTAAPTAASSTPVQPAAPVAPTPAPTATPIQPVTTPKPAAAVQPPTVTPAPKVAAPAAQQPPVVPEVKQSPAASQPDPTPVTVPTPQPVAPVVPPTPQPAAPSAPTPINTQPSTPTTTTAPTPAAIQPTPQPAAPSAPQPSTPAPAVPTPTQPATAPTVAASTPAPAAIDFKTIETDALNRIRQIKAEVNTAVGNPVNLVDINDEVGREYMNSLLSAMKKLNAGAPGELNTAMQLLEASFVKVKETIASQGPTLANNTTDTAVSPAPAQPVAPATLEPVQPVPEPRVTEPVSVPAAATTKDTQQLVDSLTANLRAGSRENMADDRPSATPVATEQPAPATLEPVQPVPEPRATDPIPTTPETQAPIKKIEPEPKVAALSPSDNQQQPTPATTPIQSVAKTAHAFTHTPATVMKNSGLEVDAMGQEVTTGLQQLLSEWSLFKSSGLFGTGPNGIEHPVYLKLKDLPVSHILAGRYEGAKQEIKQSVTDYMNGWRYEQGIVYQPGETFEQYLRRVIKQIIDSQNAKQQA